MTDRSRPALSAITIRRLVLPPESGAEASALGSAVAAALNGRGSGGPAQLPRSDLAGAIARAISEHPSLANLRPLPGRRRHGGR